MSKKLTKREAARQAQVHSPADPDSAAETAAPELQPPSFFADPTVRRWLPIAALVLLAFLALFPTLQGAYIWDDDQWLTNNGLVIEDGHMGIIWLDPNASPQYYPLVYTSYWIEYRLFHGIGKKGPDGTPRGVGYHADNLLMHIGSAILIFLILKRLKLPGGELGAWLAATIFAVHPVSVESVAWIAERKNCLGGLLFFASLFFGLKFFHVFADDSGLKTQDSGLKKWLPYAAAMLLFILSMFAKTTACVIGPVLLLMIWWRRGRINVREILLSLPFFLIAAVMGGFTAYLEKQHVGAVGPEWQFSILQRFLIAGTDLWFYIGKLLVPYPVMQIYPRFDIVAGQSVTNPLYYIAPVAYFALVVAFFLLRKKISRGPVTALLFFVGVLTPALGFINFYTMLYTFVADHYQYFACIAIIVLAVETVLWLLKLAASHVPAAQDPEAPVRFLRLTTWLLSGGIILALTMLAHSFSDLYVDAELLWTFNDEHNNTSFEVCQCLALARLSQVPPNVKGGIDALLQATRRAPEDWRAYAGLGKIYLDNNQPEEGMKYLTQAEVLMPEFVRKHRATQFDRKAADIVAPARDFGRIQVIFGPHFLLGMHYQDVGEWDKAIPEFLADIEQFPGDFIAYVHIGICYNAKDDPATALQWFQKSIDREPKDAEAWLQLGLTLNALNRKEESDAALQKAIDLNPALVQHEMMRAKAEQYRQKPKAP